MPDLQKNITFEITAGTIIKALAIVVGAYLLYVLRDVVLVVFLAVVFASAIEPAVEWLIERRIPRVFAVLSLYLVFGVILAGVFYIFVPLLLQDTSEFLAAVPQYINSISLWTSTDVGVETSRQAAELSQNIVDSRDAISSLEGSVSIQDALTNVNNAIANVSGSFVRTVNTIFGGAIGFVLVIALSFYLAVQEDGVEKFLRIITPLQHEKYVLGLWKRSREKIGRWMQGQLVLAILVGVLVYLSLTILGIRNALLFALLAAFLEIIPLFGPILAAVPAVATAYADSGFTLALVVTGVYIIIQQFENHLIYPLVVRKIVGVPPILVILALIIGAKLGGFLGIIVSVPLAAMLVEFLDDIQKRKMAQS